MGADLKADADTLVARLERVAENMQDAVSGELATIKAEIATAIEVLEELRKFEGLALIERIPGAIAVPISSYNDGQTYVRLDVNGNNTGGGNLSTPLPKGDYHAVILFFPRAPVKR